MLGAIILVLIAIVPMALIEFIMNRRLRKRREAMTDALMASIDRRIEDG